MTRPLILWGAGGHAKVLHECATALGFELAAVFDDNPAVESFAGLPVRHGFDALSKWLAQNPSGEPIACLVAIGDPVRLDIQTQLQARGLHPVAVVHRRAFVAEAAQIGDGAQVLAHAVVGVDARVGRAVIINSAAVVDHDCRVGDGSHIGPNATLTGRVTIGERTLIGAGAVVLPGMTIGSRVTIGAGAVVVADVPDGRTAFGCPARLQPNP